MCNKAWKTGYEELLSTLQLSSLWIVGCSSSCAPYSRFSTDSYTFLKMYFLPGKLGHLFVDLWCSLILLPELITISILLSLIPFSNGIIYQHMLSVVLCIPLKNHFCITLIALPTSTLSFVSLLMSSYFCWVHFWLALAIIVPDGWVWNWLLNDVSSNFQTSHHISCLKVSLRPDFHDFNTFDDPVTVVYLLFLHAILPSLTHANKFVQREEPLIHILKPQLINFYKPIAGKYLKPSAIVLEIVLTINIYQLGFGQWTSISWVLQNKRSTNCCMKETNQRVNILNYLQVQKNVWYDRIPFAMVSLWRHMQHGSTLKIDWKRAFCHWSSLSIDIHIYFTMWTWSSWMSSSLLSCSIKHCK